MKRHIILAAVLILSATALFAKTEAKNDTITADNAKVEKVIIDETTKSNGEPTTKYYFLYDGELVSTSRSTVEKYNLAQKHGARCALAVVINRKTNKKRITLN